MTTDEELFDALKLTPIERKAIQVLQASTGGSGTSVVAEWVHGMLLPLTRPSYYKAAAAFVDAEKVAAASAPVTVRYINGTKLAANGTKLCTKEGCTIKHEQHGLCSKHYQRYLRNYVPILPLSVNDDGALVDQDGKKICTVCHRHRSASKGLCSYCNYDLKKAATGSRTYRTARNSTLYDDIDPDIANG